MSPRKDRKEMSAQGVKPCISELNDHVTVLFHQPAHFPEDKRRVGKVLECVGRDNNVGFLRASGNERAPVGYTLAQGFPSSQFEKMRLDLEPDDVSASVPGEVDRVFAAAATEVDDHLIAQFREDARTEIIREFVDPLNRTIVVCRIVSSGKKPPQKSIGERSADKTHIFQGYCQPEGKTIQWKTVSMQPLVASAQSAALHRVPGAGPIGFPEDRTPDNPSSRWGLYAALCLVFIRFSMIHEALAFKLGINLYLLYIFGPPAILAAVFSGGLQRTFRNRAALCWLGLMFCMACSALFSSWRGGSVPQLIDYVRTQFPMLIVVGGLIVTWRDCLMMLRTLAASALVSVGIGRVFMGVDEGRMSLDMRGSSIANSNDLAAHLLLLLPFLVYFIIRPGARTITRILFSVVVGYGLFIILGTASRGALVGLGSIGLLVLIRAGAKQKSALIIAVVAGALVLVPALPQETLERLTSFSSDSGIVEASGSADLRRYVLQRSIEFTFSRPIFGVGMGQFMNFEGGSGSFAGMAHGAYIETHNAYTQISSECGIPAFLFYATAMISVFLTFSRAYRLTRGNPELTDMAAAAFIGLSAVTGFLVCTTFLAFGYKLYQPGLVGFAVAFGGAIPREIAARMRAASERSGVPGGIGIGGRALTPSHAGVLRPVFPGGPVGPVPRNKRPTPRTYTS